MGKGKKYIGDEFVEYLSTHRQKDTAEHFGISLSLVQKWQYKYVSKEQSEIMNKNKDKALRPKKKLLNKDELYQYYIVENHTYAECTKHFNCHINVVTDSVKEYKMYKDKEKIYSNIEKTSMQKYGVKSTLLLDDIKEKIKKTNLERYGYENPIQSQILKDKIAKEYLEKNGISHYTMSNINHYDIYSDKEKFINFLKDIEKNDNKKYTIVDLSNFFNADITTITKKVHKLGVEDYVLLKPSKSHYEKEIVEELIKLGVNRNDIIENDRTVLDGKEIDIYLPDYKMGIEFNGDYWHCDIYHDDHNGRTTFHQEKSLLAESKGVFLFHIFEREWNDTNCKQNILNRLSTILNKNKIKIPARKCSIVELSKEQKSKFLDDNHIQGNDHSTKCYGLMYDDEIVSCMTFIHPKNKKYTWELSRFCSKHEYNVQGGASKLLSNFVRTLQKGDTISSYNDITKTQGKLYENLGFECKSINPPNYVWMNFMTHDIRTRYQEQKGGENERMHNLGYHKVCDCGTKTWVYTVS